MDADVDPNVPRRRGRPRSAQAHQAVLSATLELFAADGFSELTIEGVAERAGVAKTTIYRWWPSKVALLLEAISVVRQQAATPDTGSVRADAVAHLQQFIDLHTDPRVVRMLAELLAEAARSPDLGESRASFTAAQRKPLRQALERGVARGELPADLDYELAMDLLLAPIVNRALATGGALAPQLAERIVDCVLDGLRGTTGSSTDHAQPDPGGPGEPSEPSVARRTASPASSNNRASSRRRP